MRSLVFIDPSISDDAFVRNLRQEIPRRLKLLEQEFSATPWTSSFADSEYGSESMADLKRDISHYHKSIDAVIIVPHADHVNQDHGNKVSQILRSRYLERIAGLASEAAKHGLPVIAFFANAHPRADYNLTAAGVTAIVDGNCEPALLPLKIAKAVNKGANASGQIEIGRMHVDMKSGEVKIEGKHVHLTKTEKGLFISLLRNRGSVRSKESLMSDLYEIDEPDIKIVDVFMAKLRRRLNDAIQGFGYDLLRTDWGNGYLIPAAMPADRIHMGMLRLDPQENGRYQVADTSITIGQEEFEVLDFLFEKKGHPADLNSNFFRSHMEALESLEGILSSYLASYGPAIEIDFEEDQVTLNTCYFDTQKYDASDFTSLLRQDIVAAGPYRFIKQNSSSRYILSGTEISFSLPEVRLLESLSKLPQQAVRARGLYNNVRGSSYNMRGQKSMDEDIIDLARGVYKKLLDTSFAQDPDTTIFFYHEEFLSLGAAETIPDPEVLNEARRVRLQSNLKNQMERATGKIVDLVERDFGYFRIMAHPVLGDGLIDGKGVKLSAESMKILETVHTARPQTISALRIFEAVYPNRAFNQQAISMKIHSLRRALKDVEPDSASLLTPLGGGEYISLLKGEEPPFKAKPPTIKTKTAGEDVQPEEIELSGGVVLLKNPETGIAKVKGTAISLRPQQVSILSYLASQYPRTVYESELMRETGIKGLRNAVKNLMADWTQHVPAFPVRSTSVGFAWINISAEFFNGQHEQETPLKSGPEHETSEAEDFFVNPPKMLFDFGAISGFNQHCANTGKDFTIREVELLRILDERKGQTLDTETIRNAASKFNWPDNIIEQTMTQIRRKIESTSVSSRLQIQKRKGLLLLTLC